MIPSSEIIDIFNTEASAFRWEILHENPVQLFVVSTSYDNPIVFEVTVAGPNAAYNSVLETIQSWYPHRKIFRLQGHVKDFGYKSLSLCVRMLTPAHLLHADEVRSQIWFDGFKCEVEMFIDVVAQGSRFEYRLFNGIGDYRWKSTRKWCAVKCALGFSYSLEDFHNTGIVVPRFTSYVLRITDPSVVWEFLMRLVGRRFMSTIGIYHEPVVYLDVCIHRPPSRTIRWVQYRKRK